MRQLGAKRSDRLRASAQKGATNDDGTTEPAPAMFVIVQTANGDALSL
jgi:hypothetical protein